MTQGYWKTGSVRQHDVLTGQPDRNVQVPSLTFPPARGLVFGHGGSGSALQYASQHLPPPRSGSIPLSRHHGAAQPRKTQTLAVGRSVGIVFGQYLSLHPYQHHVALVYI